MFENPSHAENESEPSSQTGLSFDTNDGPPTNSELRMGNCL